MISLPEILPADRIRAFRSALVEQTRPRRNSLAEYPLTGRIQGACGRPYIGCFRTNHRVRTYRCSGWQATVSCGCVFLRADHAEEQVARRVNALLASLPLSVRPMPQASLEAEVRLARQLERVRALEGLLRQCTEELRGLRSPSQDSRVIAAAMRQLEGEQQVFERILAHARDWLAELRGRVNRDARLAALLRETAPDIRSLSSAERRCLIESLDVHVEIRDPDFRYREGTRCLTTQWHERTGALVPPDPTDSQWARVEALLRSKYGAHHFRSPLDLRAALKRMLHRLRTGILWRDLPERFGSPEKVRVRQRAWLTDGVWPDIVRLLGEEGKGTPPVVSYEAAPALVVRTGLDAEALC